MTGTAFDLLVLAGLIVVFPSIVAGTAYVGSWRQEKRAEARRSDPARTPPAGSVREPVGAA